MTELNAAFAAERALARRRVRSWMGGASLVALTVAAVGIATPVTAWAASGGQGIFGTGTGGGAGGEDGDAEEARGKKTPSGSGGGGATDLTTGRGAAGGNIHSSNNTPPGPGTDGKIDPSVVEDTYAGTDGPPGLGGGAGLHTGGGGGGVGVRTTLDLTVKALGVVTGGSGGNGGSSSGGGGGGVGIFTSQSVTIDAGGNVTGGSGGRQGGFGGGGGGAAALLLTGGGTVTNGGRLTGGAGGGSTASANFIAAGGNGAEGVLLTNGGVVINQAGASITGGKGGRNGSKSGIVRSLGGAGIKGGGLTIVNAGTITGGMDGDIGGTNGDTLATTRANAITFTGGVNSLELHKGSVIIGNVVALGTADRLILGGEDDASFDASAIGADAQYQGFEHFEKTGGSTWTLTGTNSFSGDTLVSGGTLAAGGTDAFGATSSHTVATGGTLDLVGFSQVTGALDNAGSVRLGGAGNTTLTVAGKYVGTGGTLHVSSVLDADNSSTDLLNVLGGTSGTTNVVVTNVGGAGAQTSGDGIRIVQVEGDSAADAFVLAGPAIGGAYRYGLFQNDLTGQQDDGDWYLRADGLAPPVPTYESYPAVMLGLISLPTLQQRVGDRRPDKTGEAANTALWTRIEGAHARVKADSSTTDASYDSDVFQLQVGFDGEVMENAAGALVAG